MTADHALPPPLRRLATGVDGLDEILGGGFVSGGLYLVEGQPGTGKTILANQISFHRARAGERALYITVLAESHGKMLAHIRSMAFFDESLVFRSVVYLSGYRPLVEDGTGGMLAMLTGAVREHRPSLLVIDGVRGVRAFSGGENAFGVFIHELGALIAATRCTTLMLAPSEPGAIQPEHSIVDGILELARVPVGLRSIREVEIHKHRGGPHSFGRHVCKIDEDGFRVFPRLEATVGELPAQALAGEGARVAFDVPNLDAMTGGGLVAGSMTSVVGPPGAGKTLLGLKFLEAGVRRGEPSLYFGFYETPERLLIKAGSTRIDLAGAVTAGLLRLMWHSPIEQLLDELVGHLLTDIRERAVRRVVLDGIEGFRDAAAYVERVPNFIIALTATLRASGVTALMTEEAPSVAVESHPPVEDLSALVENLLLMRCFEVGATVHRVFSVAKLRDSAHDLSAREFHITERGFEVDASSRGAEALLREFAGAASQPRGRVPDTRGSPGPARGPGGCG